MQTAISVLLSDLITYAGVESRDELSQVLLLMQGEARNCCDDLIR